MAGHSKWAQIKRAKAVTDAARSRVFSRFAREIALESKKASGNVSAPSLAAAITRAKAANMPKDNIERAITKGASKDSGELEQVSYEFYGPRGIAVIAVAVTDSRNRTTQEMKHLLSKNGYELGTPGSASWAFTRLPDGTFRPNEPLMEVPADAEEKLGEILDIVDEQEDVQEVVTNALGFQDTEP